MEVRGWLSETCSLFHHGFTTNDLVSLLHHTLSPVTCFFLTGNCYTLVDQLLNNIKTSMTSTQVPQLPPASQAGVPAPISNSLPALLPHTAHHTDLQRPPTSTRCIHWTRVSLSTLLVSATSAMPNSPYHGCDASLVSSRSSPFLPTALSLSIQTSSMFRVAMTHAPGLSKYGPQQYFIIFLGYFLGLSSKSLTVCSDDTLPPSIPVTWTFTFPEA